MHMPSCKMHLIIFVGFSDNTVGTQTLYVVSKELSTDYMRDCLHTRLSLACRR